MTNTVAQTILSQLGGNRFVAMTGAKNLTSSANALTMKINGRYFGKKVSHIRVTLDAVDLYTIEALDCPGTKPIMTRNTVSGVGAEDLAPVFTTLTGLHTRL